LLTLDAIFTAPFGRPFRLGLHEMVRDTQQKQRIKHEKLIRKFDKQCKMEEAAAVYGFKSDVDLGLLDIKVPTLPCIAAPNEPEKDFLAIPTAKPQPPRKLANGRSESKSGLPLMPNGEELGSPNAQLMDRRTSSNRREKRRGDRSGVLSGGLRSNGHPVRAGRRRKDYMLETRGSDLSLSQADLDARQLPPTLEDFLARSDDQLLFITASDLLSNWEIVSDVMASAGFFMSHEACKERHQSIETTIKRHQSQLIRSGEQGSMDDILLKQLRTTEVREGIRKRIPDPLAAKYAQYTSNAHRKRIQKLKNQPREEGAPTAHVSQRKLSEEVLKTMGGRVGNPKESWTRAQKQNVARSLATKLGHTQITAAKAAARQNFNRMNVGGTNSMNSSSQPMMTSHGVTFDPQKRIQTSQQGQMHLTETLTEPGAWPGNGFMGNVAPGSHVQSPWMPSHPPGLPPLQSLVGAAKAQGQTAFPGNSLMSLRPGFNTRGAMPQHIVGNIQPTPQDQQGAIRAPRTVRPVTQNPLSCGNYTSQQQTSQSTQQFMAQLLSKFHGNTNLLQQYIQNGSMRPDERLMLNRAVQDNRRFSSGSGSSRIVQSPTGPQVISSGTAMRKTQTPMTSTGEQFSASHNMVAAMATPHPPVLEHPVQFNPRTPSTPVREYLDPSVMPPSRHPARPRTQMTPFGFDHGLEGGMVEGMNPAAASQLELHQDLSSNTVDVRHALHGMGEDRTQILDGHQGLQQTQMGAGNYPEIAPDGTGGGGYRNDPRTISTRQLSPYTRLAQRPHGP